MHDRARKTVGETVFAAFLVGLSAFLLWQAYGIAGFSKLSSPGAFPMAVTAVMLVSSLLILVRTLKLKEQDSARLFTDVLPPVILVMIGMILGYAILLKPLGFLPTSLLFLTLSIWYLRRGGLVYSVGVSVLSLAIVYIIFRLVFSVLMPAGIVPEGEILAWFGNLLSGNAGK